MAEVDMAAPRVAVARWRGGEVAGAQGTREEAEKLDVHVEKVRAMQQLRELCERAPLQRPAILRTALGDERERAERSRRHQSGKRPLSAARIAHPVGERRRSRRGRTGPRDRLALGASHPDIAGVAVAADDVAAAVDTAAADSTTLLDFLFFPIFAVPD